MTKEVGSVIRWALRLQGVNLLCTPKMPSSVGHRDGNRYQIMTEINEPREKLKRYECWEAGAFSERKTKWDFHPEETYKSFTTISVEALKALALIAATVFANLV